MTSRKRLYLLYHELRPQPSRYTYVLSTAAFAQHIELFARLRKTPASLYPEITFDDGHISNYEHALPILTQHSVPATFFITAGWTGTRTGYMGPAELRALHNAGHTIGAHGWSHTLLTHCSPSELHTELTQSRRVLEDHIGAPVTTLSLPGGRANARVFDAIRNAGYTQVYTSVPQPERDPTAAILGRLNILSTMTPDYLTALLTPTNPALPALQKSHQRKQLVQSLLGDRLYARLWSLINRQETESD